MNIWREKSSDIDWVFSKYDETNKGNKRCNDP